MDAMQLPRTDRQYLGGLFALAVCVGEIPGVWRSLRPLFGAWSQQEYSHAWFIPPLALLIFIHRLRTAAFGGYRAPGIFVALFSVIAMMFAWATGSYTACIYGAILGISGFVWSSLGTQAMKTLAVPLAYLLFMVPLPVAVYISASAEMQLQASKLGLVLISAFHVPASLDGNIIVLPSARLEVTEACNGLRYLFPLVSFACLVAMLVEDRLWKKALIIASSVPIAIVLNAIRIAMIAVLLERFGIDASTGWAHDVQGFAVFSLCIALLFAEVRWLLGLGNSRGRLVLSGLLSVDRSAIGRLLSWPVSPASLVAGIILISGTSLVARWPARAEVVLPRQPLALFPMEFSGWHGVPTTLDSASLDALGLTDYLLADYSTQASAGGPLNFYIAYYASQRAGIHAHSPQLCIPGGGWNILSQSTIPIPSRDGDAISENRVVIEKRGLRQIVYYWFEERGRHIADEGALKYYALRDALIDNRTDGALIRIVAPISAADEAASDSMAMKLIADASPLLHTFIPADVSKQQR